MTAALLPPPPDWTRDALCAETDPEAFFPDKGGSTREAKAICNGTPLGKKGEPRDPCPVREQCLAHALDRDERFGIWGGLSEKERRRLSDGRRKQAPINHGTESGYKVHRRRGEQPCASCLEANREKSRRVSKERYWALRSAPEPVEQRQPAPESAPEPVQRSPRPWTTEEQRAAIRTCTAAGMSAPEIASQLGISERTVIRHRPKRRGAAA